ncbi:hypothetical protein [uncultured Enterovirga sp.]|uniref:alginate O-acetyltransferase AlgX-related protein n=1 Tax=uncultured Enterovirga sp. TaxID=2026352 RepID=UPI0035CC1E9D
MDKGDLETVHIGRDGWLFLVGGRNDVLRQYSSGGLSPELLADWKGLHEDRHRRCGELGARYLNLVVPEKIAVYDDRLDGLRIDVAASPATQIAQALETSSARDAHIDLQSLFRSRREDIQLYLRTDSHWSFAGCHLAYEAICRKAGASPYTALAAHETRHVDVVTGDLGMKLDPPRAEMGESWRYPRLSDMVHANRLVRHFEAAGAVHASGTASLTVYRTGATDADPRTLMVFGDSYTSHVYTENVGRLIGFLAETFREVHFVWANTIDYGYVARVRPDIVLTEIAERFMIELPMTEFDLSEYERSQFERKGGRQT